MQICAQIEPLCLSTQRQTPLIYTHSCICVCVWFCTSCAVFPCTHIPLFFLRMYVRTCSDINTYIYMHIYLCVYMHTYVYIYLFVQVPVFAFFPGMTSGPVYFRNGRKQSPQTISIHTTLASTFPSQHRLHTKQFDRQHDGAQTLTANSRDESELKTTKRKVQIRNRYIFMFKHIATYPS